MLDTKAWWDVFVNGVVALLLSGVVGVCLGAYIMGAAQVYLAKRDGYDVPRGWPTDAFYGITAVLLFIGIAMTLGAILAHFDISFINKGGE